MQNQAQPPDDTQPGSETGPPAAPLTGLVLAGGGSRRMGRDKAFLKLRGRALIEIVIDQVRKACEEVFVVAREAGPYADLGVPVVSDVYQGVGVLGGLHAGLLAASHEVAVVVGCDMPFLVPALLRAFGSWADGVDVAVLRQGEHTEPLHGAYRRSCLGAIEAAIRAGRRRIISFFPSVRVRYVTAEQVRTFDPALRFLRNVNTPEEWKRVQTEWSVADSPPVGEAVSH